jgi:hypothetical protein
MAEELQVSVVLSSIQDLPRIETLSGSDFMVVAQKVGEDWQTRSAEF